MASTREINILVKAKDEATKVLKDVSKAIDFKAVATGAAVAGAAMTAFLGSTIGGAAEAQAANAQLEYAVTKVTKATEEQLQATMDLADELERKGVLDGDAIKFGIAQLSTFGLSNEAVQGLAGSMADLAVNQFGVNASGDQLTQTANIMAKALQGQFGVLEKSGIRFTEAQQKMIMFGSEMEKVTALNEGLQQNLKYTNEVALQTFEGQWAQLNVQIGNFTEAIGTALFPVLIGMFEKLRPIVDIVNEWIGNNEELFTVIVSVTGVVAILLTALGGLGLIIGPITAGFAGLAAVVAALASPITLVVAGIAALTAGIIYLWNTNEGFRAAVENAWSVISSTILTVTATVKEQIISFITTVRGLWESDWEGIRTAVETFSAWFSDEFLPAFQEFMILISTAMGELAGQIQTHWDSIKLVFDIGLGAIKLFWDLVWNNMKLTFTTTWEIIKGLIKTGLALIKGDWEGAWSAIKGIFTGIWDGMKTYLAGIVDSIKNFVSILWNFAQEKFTTASMTVKGIWDGFWGGLADSATKMIDGLMKKLSELWGLIQQAAEGLNNLNPFGGGSAIKAAASMAAGKRATGGLVGAGRPYIVGEQRPELFVPDQRGMIVPSVGGGSVTNVYISGNTMLSDDVAEQIGDMFFSKFRMSNLT